MEPKVTVILPSLNVAGYIGETLMSALNQTLKGLELICVDAGSTDGTLDIIEDYRQQAAGRDDLTFTLLHSDVRSYGHQVNLGLDVASGDWIAILETDDIAAPEMYEELYNLGEKHRADIVKSTYFDYMGEANASVTLAGGSVISGSARPSLLAAISAPKPVFKIQECPELLLHHPSVWSALYRRSFLKAKQIRMPEIPGAGWADNPFMLESLLKADRITYTPEAYYYYRKDNPGSSTALKNCRMPFERIREMREILRKLVPAGDPAYDIISETLDHRALNYSVDAMKSPALNQETDVPFIRSALETIPESYLQDCHVTAEEREAYNFFTGRRVGESLKHRMDKLAYTSKYGFGYIKNTKLK